MLNVNIRTCKVDNIISFYDCLSWSIGSKLSQSEYKRDLVGVFVDSISACLSSYKNCSGFAECLELRINQDSTRGVIMIGFGCLGLQKENCMYFGTVNKTDMFYHLKKDEILLFKKAKVKKLLEGEKGVVSKNLGLEAIKKISEKGTYVERDEIRDFAFARMMLRGHLGLGKEGVAVRDSVVGEFKLGSF